LESYSNKIVLCISPPSINFSISCVHFGDVAQISIFSKQETRNSGCQYLDISQRYQGIFPPESLFLSIWKDVKRLLEYVLCNLGYAKVRQWRENSKQGTFLNSSFCLRPDSFMYLTTTTTNGGTKGLEAGAAPRSWGWALRTNYIRLVMGSPLH